MCGIVGMIAPRADKNWRIDMAFRLLEATEVRGKDATGIAWYNEDGTSTLVKAPLPAHKFIRSKEFLEVIDDIPGTWIGHCRAITQGSAANNMNNHPIRSRDTGLIVVHNGAIEDRPWRALDADGNNPYMLNGFDADVDSEAIVRLWETLRYIPRMADGKIVPEMVETTPKEEWQPEACWHTAARDTAHNLSGAFAVAGIVPDEVDTVYLFRNKDRPLYLAYVPDYDALVFASTQEILKYAMTDYDTVFNYFFVSETPEYIGREVSEKTVLKLSATEDAFDVKVLTFAGEPKGKGASNRVSPAGKVYQEEFNV